MAGTPAGSPQAAWGSWPYTDCKVSCLPREAKQMLRFKNS